MHLAHAGIFHACLSYFKSRPSAGAIHLARAPSPGNGQGVAGSGRPRRRQLPQVGVFPKIPSSKLEEPLNFAVWNIREFGKKARLIESIAARKRRSRSRVALPKDIPWNHVKR